MSDRGRLSLIWLLLAGAFAEVLLHRVVVRLLDLHLLGTSGDGQLLRSAAQLGGQFAFHFTGTLALVMCAWAVYALARDERLLALPWRIAIATSASILLSLATVGLFFNLHRRGAVVLDAAFVTLLATLLLTVVANRGSARLKLGIVYLVSILLLRGVWLVEHQLAQLLHWPTGPLSWATEAYRASDHLIAGAALVMLFCFAPLERHKALFRPLPLLVGLVATALVTMFVVSEYPLAELVAQRGFNLQLPDRTSLVLALYVAAVFPFTLTITALLSAGPVPAGIGLGLLAISLSGYYLITPQQILLTLVGVLQLLRATLDPQAHSHGVGSADTHAAPSIEQWKRYLSRLAAGCSDQQATNEALVLQHQDGKIARVRSTLDGVPYAVRLAIRSGRLEELEVDVGQPPKDEPPATLARKKGSRGGRVPNGRGPRVKDFDHQFALRDGTSELAHTLSPLLDDLRESVHGWIGLWPAEGLRYLCRPIEREWPVPVSQIAKSSDEADVQALQRLVRLLVDLAHRVDVRG